MRVFMIGHSTMLIELAGKRILTDPFFSTRGNMAYKRPKPPARNRKFAKDVDVVLISHNHFDHIDRQYLDLLPDTVPVLAPRASAWSTALIHGAKNIVDIRPWQDFQLGNVTITAVPAIHFAPTLGYVIQGDEKQLYFAGDTFYGSFMRQIGQRFHLTAAFIPVTTFRIPMTMNEKGALRAAEALKSRYIIPIHLGIQPRFPLLGGKQTPDSFIKQLKETENNTRVTTLFEGETWFM